MLHTLLKNGCKVNSAHLGPLYLTSKHNWKWSKMIKHYWRIVQRYPKPNGMTGSTISNHEIFSLLHGKKSQVIKCLLSSKKKKLIGRSFVGHGLECSERNASRCWPKGGRACWRRHQNENTATGGAWRCLYVSDSINLKHN